MHRPAELGITSMGGVGWFCFYDGLGGWGEVYNNYPYAGPIGFPTGNMSYSNSSTVVDVKFWDYGGYNVTDEFVASGLCWGLNYDVWMVAGDLIDMMIANLDGPTFHMEKHFPVEP